MKNRKDILAVFTIGVLLLSACMIPKIVTVLEDMHLEKEKKKYEIEEITLNNREEDLTEKLAAIQDVLLNHSLLDLDVVKKSETEMSQRQTNIEKCAKEFFAILNDAEEPEFLKFSADLLLMTDIDADNVYSLWRCYAVGEDEDEYILWIDDETEKVLAFETLSYRLQMVSEEFYQLVYRMADYYGFTEFEIMDKVSGFFQGEYSELAVLFLDEVKREDVTLNFYRNWDRIYFNTYPGEVSVYKSTQEVN